jgi:hypothetical protein
LIRKQRRERCPGIEDSDESESEANGGVDMNSKFGRMDLKEDGRYYGDRSIENEF